MRHVEPVQVFELGFEGIAPLDATPFRHRGPVPADAAMAPDKPAAEADTLDNVRRLLAPDPTGSLLAPESDSEG